MKLYNKYTKKEEDVPDDQFIKAYESGQYEIKKGTKIPVVSPFGIRGTIDADELKPAIDEGYQFEGFEKQKVREERKQYEAPVTAGALGALRGASFGLTDIIATKTGLVKPETIAKYKEYNPTESLAGEVGGVLGTALIPGFPVARVAQLGTKVTGAVGKKIGAHIAESTASKIAKKAAAVGAGGAVEGAFYGTGQLISDTALGRPPKNAEDIVATVGLSSLFGGGLGFVFKGFTEGAPVALKRLANAPIPGLRTATQKASQAWADLSAFVSGADKEVLRKAYALNKEGKEVREAFTNYTSQEQKLSKDLADYIKKQDSEFKAVKKEFYQEGQPAERLIINEEVPIERAIAAANEITAKGMQTVRMMRDDPYTFSKTNTNKIEKLLNKYANNSQNVISEDIKTAPAKIFGNIETFKRELDSLIPYGKLAKVVERNYVETLSDLAGYARNQLEDATLWGSQAVRQEAINDAFEAVKRTDESFYKFFGKGKEGRKQFDESRLHAYVTKLHKESGEVRRQALDDRLEAMRAFSDVSKTGKPGVLHPDSEVRKEIEKQLANLQTARQLKWYTERSGNTLLPFGIAGGALAAGINPEVVGEAAAVYGALRNPAQALRALSWLEKTVIGVDSKLYKGAESFLKNEKVQKFSKDANKIPLIYYQNNLSEKRKQYEENLEKYKELNMDPGQLVDKISANIGEFNEYAPSTSQALAQKMSEGLSFLLQAMPKKASVSTLDMTPEIPLSDYEINKFAQIEKLIFYPMSILDELDENSINKDSVDIIKQVYPELYQNITQQFIQAFMNNRDIEIPYKKRLALSTLLGTPLDNSLNPRFISAMQQTNQTSRMENEQKQQQQKINAGQLSKSKSLDSLTTPFQQAMSSV